MPSSSFVFLVSFRDEKHTGGSLAPLMNGPIVSEIKEALGNFSGQIIREQGLPVSRIPEPTPHPPQGQY